MTSQVFRPGPTFTDTGSDAEKHDDLTARPMRTLFGKSQRRAIFDKK